MSFDLIAYGATGFTGRQVSRYLAEHAPPGLRWAIAGRNRAKLETLAQTLPEGVGVVVADAMDPDAVDAMVRQTRVLTSTAGPFASYGDHVVDACVRHGVHYTDITGEVVWVRRLIARHHQAAREAGTVLVPMCGFDSVPSDLGTWMVVRHLASRGEATREVRAHFASKGGFNGGTIASLMTSLDDADVRKTGSPWALVPDFSPSPEQRAQADDVRGPYRDPRWDRWSMPFFMATVNTRVVRRSNHLFGLDGAAYGPDFHYQEYMTLKQKGWLPHAMATASLGAGIAALASPLGPRLVDRFLPAPGEGPSEADMDGGWTRTTYFGEGVDGGRVVGRFHSPGDPGNRTTVRILVEGTLALCAGTGLTLEPGHGGVLTPAYALGEVLLERLRAAGTTWTVEDDPA